MIFRRVHRTLLTATGCAAILVLSQSAFAAGNAERGKEKSVPCQACHGPTGNGENPAFPKIAGQHKSYLLHALTAYSNGERSNAIMQGMVAPLSQQDREDLAAWYSIQDGLDTLDGQR